MSHFIFILAFSTNFCPIKTDPSGNTFWPKFQVFKNSPKGTIFEKLLSTQNVNVACFARNVEWDFFCDFQTPWIPSQTKCSDSYRWASPNFFRPSLNLFFWGYVPWNSIPFQGSWTVQRKDHWQSPGFHMCYLFDKTWRLAWSLDQRQWTDFALLSSLSDAALWNYFGVKSNCRGCLKNLPDAI